MEPMNSIMLLYITLNGNLTIKLTVLVGNFVFKNPVKQPSSPVVSCSSMVRAYLTSVMKVLGVLG